MDSPPLYIQLADHYRKAIQAGTLQPGQRLPSVRELTRQHRVSLSTALQACRKLEADALVEARARSGYFVSRRRVRVLAPVAEPDAGLLPDLAQYAGIHDKVSAFVVQHAQVAIEADFSLASAAPDCYPVEKLKLAMARALRRAPEMLCSRTPFQGHPALRATLARRALDCGIQAGPDEVIVTHGCIEALNLALRAVARPGDTVAVESPTFFGLLQVLESLGLRALEIPTSPQHGLSLEALDLAFETYPGIKAVVVIPNHHNPLGCVMPDAHKARLAALCETRGAALIEDDTYGLLGDATAPSAIKAWDGSGNVIYCSSMHKTLAPGMRQGWMVGGCWADRIKMLKYAQSRPNEPLAQVALAAFMASRDYDRHLARLCQRLKAQREDMADAIARYFPRGTRLNPPVGGLFLWVALPEGTSSMAVFNEALRRGVRVAPGAIFSNSHRYDHFLRISAGTAYGSETDRALRLLADVVARQPRA